MALPLPVPLEGRATADDLAMMVLDQGNARGFGGYALVTCSEALHL